MSSNGVPSPKVELLCHEYVVLIRGMHGTMTLRLGMSLESPDAHSKELVTEKLPKLRDAEQWRALSKNSKFRPSNGDLRSGHAW